MWQMWWLVRLQEAFHLILVFRKTTVCVWTIYYSGGRWGNGEIAFAPQPNLQCSVTWPQSLSCCCGQFITLRLPPRGFAVALICVFKQEWKGDDCYLFSKLVDSVVWHSICRSSCCVWFGEKICILLWNLSDNMYISHWLLPEPVTTKH